MSYYIYQLKFDSPVHFGDTALGGGLEKIRLDYPSDTLFSALCCELAQAGEQDLLDRLYNKAAAGDMAFSDLLPYATDEQDECQFYVPKPVIDNIAWYDGQDRQYDAMCRDLQKRKAIKKMKYIRASHLEEYMKAVAGQGDVGPDVKFAEDALAERVNCRPDDPLPYYVGQYTFYDNTGLYGIVKADEDDMEWLTQVFQLLGLNGIGGKRSSGYGKFHLYDDPLILDEQGVYADDKELYKRLLDTGKSWQMAISMVLPAREDIKTVMDGWYALQKRSGFVEGAAGTAAKRDTVYMAAAGSCFRERIAGSIAVLREWGHPVYRYGKGLYLGLR